MRDEDLGTLIAGQQSQEISQVAADQPEAQPVVDEEASGNSADGVCGIDGLVVGAPDGYLVTAGGEAIGEIVGDAFAASALEARGWEA
jgi:hypothetical protein